MNQDLAVLQAVRNALIADGLTVYDGTAPQGESMPYVTIGRIVCNTNDTDNTTGFNATMTIHAWSDKRGRLEASTMQKTIYDALHRQDYMSLPFGYEMIGIDQEFSEVMVDPDGITRHGVQQFNVLFDKPETAS